MALKSLLRECVVTEMIPYTAAGTTTILSGRVLDMQGFEGVAFIASIGTVTAGGVIQVRPRHGAVQSTTGMVTMTSYVSGTTASTTAMTRRIIINDLYRPTKRYVSVNLHRATANALVESVIAVQYGSKKKPVSQSTGVGTGVSGGGVIDGDFYTAPTT